MLKHPTEERLSVLGLAGGMAKGTRGAKATPRYCRVSRFEERFAPLVDRVRQPSCDNKRLVARLRFASLRQNAVVEDVDAKAPRGPGPMRCSRGSSPASGSRSMTT